jgi:hypothetical protein
MALGVAGVFVAPGRAAAAPWTVASLADGLTAAQLAATLVGPGITVNSASFTGSGLAGGTFSDPAASVGLAQGIVLSSGNVHDVVGPNDSGGTTTQLGQPGSADLNALLPAGQTTQDAAILDVNFTPTNPQLAINYVFASEEYEEYVNSQFNDVFAFFVNGVNCAVTPGTTNPITINTVNPGANALFYVPNEPPAYDTQFDGFTVVLTCRAAVNPGVPNTLRLAIADTSDQRLDSAVFLQANGVSSNPIGPLQPISPTRLLDTRFANPTALTTSGLSPQSIIPAGQSISLKVTGGEVTDSALAVALNVTAVDAASAGFITVYPEGGAQPNTSSVNFTPGEASPNAVVSRVGTGGRIRIFSSADVNVIVDVFGWFGTGGHDRLFTIVPDRLIDTRTTNTPVAAGQTIAVTVAGSPRVPNGATAAVLNVTATDAAGPGFLTVYPSNKETPNVSSVNFLQGEARPNTVIAPLGPDGKIKVFASQTAHVIVDVMGWFGSAGQTEYVEVAPPQRLFDSRLPTGGSAKIGAGQSKSIQIVGQFVPPNARSVVLNVTIAEPDASGFATVYPGGAVRPNTSNLNYRAGQAIPNAVIVGLGPTGNINIYTSSTAHLLVDVVGYFA